MSYLIHASDVVVDRAWFGLVWLVDPVPGQSVRERASGVSGIG